MSWNNDMEILETKISYYGTHKSLGVIGKPHQGKLRKKAQVLRRPVTENLRASFEAQDKIQSIATRLNGSSWEGEIFIGTG
jgi:hypothetical protein